MTEIGGEATRAANPGDHKGQDLKIGDRIRILDVPPAVSHNRLAKSGDVLPVVWLDPNAGKLASIRVRNKNGYTFWLLSSEVERVGKNPGSGGRACVGCGKAITGARVEGYCNGCGARNPAPGGRILVSEEDMRRIFQPPDFETQYAGAGLFTLQEKRGKGWRYVDATGNPEEAARFWNYTHAKKVDAQELMKAVHATFPRVTFPGFSIPR